jgi:hypothetical protein
MRLASSASTEVTKELTGDATNAVNDIVNHLLANGVVTTSIVVGGILLAADQQLGVEKVTVFASSDLVNRRGVKIDEERSRNMLAAAGLSEESLERTRVTNIGSIGVGATIGAETVLEKVAIQRPVSFKFVTVALFDNPGRPRTAPKQSYRAGYQPGPGGGEESG